MYHHKRRQMFPSAEPVRSQSRRLLEEFWRLRLCHAQDRYHFAAAQTRRIVADFSTRPGGADSPVLRKAREAESAAMDDYLRLLRIFTDLVVNGKPPDKGA